MLNNRVEDGLNEFACAKNSIEEFNCQRHYNVVGVVLVRCWLVKCTDGVSEPA
jgi:hypothetical protein